MIYSVTIIPSVYIKIKNTFIEYLAGIAVVNKDGFIQLYNDNYRSVKFIDGLTKYQYHNGVMWDANHLMAKNGVNREEIKNED